MRRHILTFILLTALLAEVSCTPLKNQTTLSRAQRQTGDNERILGWLVDAIRRSTTGPVGSEWQPQTVPPPLPSGCSVQYAPNIRKTEVLGCVAPCLTVPPGVIVPNGAALVFTCVEGYVMYGPSHSICSNGLWQSTPTCVPLHSFLPRAKDF